MRTHTNPVLQDLATCLLPEGLVELFRMVRKLVFKSEFILDNPLYDYVILVKMLGHSLHQLLLSIKRTQESHDRLLVSYS